MSPTANDSLTKATQWTLRAMEHFQRKFVARVSSTTASPTRLQKANNNVVGKSSLTLRIPNPCNTTPATTKSLMRDGEWCVEVLKSAVYTLQPHLPEYTCNDDDDDDIVDEDDFSFGNADSNDGDDNENIADCDMASRSITSPHLRQQESNGGCNSCALDGMTVKRETNENGNGNGSSKGVLLSDTSRILNTMNGSRSSSDLQHHQALIVRMRLQLIDILNNLAVICQYLSNLQQEEGYCNTSLLKQSFPPNQHISLDYYQQECTQYKLEAMELSMIVGTATMHNSQSQNK